MRENRASSTSGLRKSQRRFGAIAAVPLVWLIVAALVAFMVGDADLIARWIALSVLIIGLVLFLRAWRNDPVTNIRGAGRGACVLAIAVVAPFLLGIIGSLIGLFLVPISSAIFARHWTRARRRMTAVAAWFLGFAIAPLMMWFGGRADERPAEGFIAGVLIIGAASLLVWIKIAARGSASADPASQSPTLM
jgi:uncharacterized membrane protein